MVARDSLSLSLWDSFGCETGWTDLMGTLAGILSTMLAGGTHLCIKAVNKIRLLF